MGSAYHGPPVLLILGRVRGRLTRWRVAIVELGIEGQRAGAAELSEAHADQLALMGSGELRALGELHGAASFPEHQAALQKAELRLVVALRTTETFERVVARPRRST
jgi:hypothetical protein